MKLEDYTYDTLEKNDEFLEALFPDDYLIKKYRLNFSTQAVKDSKSPDERLELMELLYREMVFNKVMETFKKGDDSVVFFDKYVKLYQEKHWWSNIYHAEFYIYSRQAKLIETLGKNVPQYQYEYFMNTSGPEAVMELLKLWERAKIITDGNTNSDDEEPIKKQTVEYHSTICEKRFVVDDEEPIKEQKQTVEYHSTICEKQCVVDFTNWLKDNGADGISLGKYKVIEDGRLIEWGNKVIYNPNNISMRDIEWELRSHDLCCCVGCGKTKVVKLD
jgi:hypothetical protein